MRFFCLLPESQPEENSSISVDGCLVANMILPLNKLLMTALANLLTTSVALQPVEESAVPQVLNLHKPAFFRD